MKSSKVESLAGKTEPTRKRTTIENWWLDPQDGGWWDVELQLELNYIGVHEPRLSAIFNSALSYY